LALVRDSHEERPGDNPSHQDVPQTGSGSFPRESLGVSRSSGSKDFAKNVRLSEGQSRRRITTSFSWRRWSTETRGSKQGLGGSSRRLSTDDKKLPLPHPHLTIDGEEKTELGFLNAALKLHIQYLRQNRDTYGYQAVVWVVLYACHFVLWVSQGNLTTATPSGPFDEATANKADIFLALSVGLSWLALTPFLRVFPSVCFVILFAEDLIDGLLAFIAVYLPINLGLALVFMVLRVVSSQSQGLGGSSSAGGGGGGGGGVSGTDIFANMLMVFELNFFHVSLSDLFLMQGRGSPHDLAVARRVVICVTYGIHAVFISLLFWSLFQAFVVLFLIDPAKNRAANQTALLSKMAVVVSFQRNLSSLNRFNPWTRRRRRSLNQHHPKDADHDADHAYTSNYIIDPLTKRKTRWIVVETHAGRTPPPPPP